METKIKLPPLRLSPEGMLLARAAAIGIPPFALALCAEIPGAGKSMLHAAFTDREAPLSREVVERVSQVMAELEELNQAVQTSVRKVAGDAAKISVDWSKTGEIQNALVARRAARILALEHRDHSVDSAAEILTKRVVK